MSKQTPSPGYSKAPIFDEKCVGTIKTLYRTSYTLNVPTQITTIANFAGLRQFEKHPEFYYIVKNDPLNQLTVIKSQFYCSICKALKKANGGDYMKHLRIHNSEPQLSKSEIINSIMRWGIRYNISFNALRDKCINRVAKGFLSDTAQMAWLDNETEKLKGVIRASLSHAETLELCSDGWTGINERFEGVIIHAMIGDECKTFALALKERESEYRGADGIVRIINSVIQDYNIDEEKLVGYVSDTCNEMQSVARKLQLPWDKCYLHVLSLIIEKAWGALPKRIQMLHSTAVNLSRCSEFTSFVMKAHLPELGDAYKIQLGCVTRWGSFIKELQSIFKFRNAINMYYTEASMEENIIPNEVFETVQQLLVPFGDINEIITEMETEDFNTNLGRVAQAFACIDNICTNFIDSNSGKNSELNRPFILIKDLLRENLFENESTSAKFVRIASYLDTSRLIPDQIKEHEEQIIEEIKQELHNIDEEFPVASEQIPVTSLNRSSPTRMHEFRKTQQNQTLDAFLNLRSSCDLPPAYQFWKGAHNFQSLRKLALRVFSKRATSVSIERWFSEISRAYTDERESLTAEHVEMIALLKGNKHLLPDDVD